MSRKKEKRGKEKLQGTTEKKAEQMRQTRKYSPATPKTPKKRPKDMTDAERRRYNADMRKKQRDARSSQKKTFDRIKRRRQWQLKKQEELQKMISNRDRKKFTKHLKKACNLNNEIKPSTKELNLTSQQYVETVPIYLTIPNSKTSEKKLANAHLQDHLSSFDQLRNNSNHNTCDLLSLAKSIIPPLASDLHKGQAGRIAVIGGCQEYTGAPYFSAITALKVGADLSHVFCTAGAATVIKSYSPELIVHPILDSEDAVNDINQWLPRFHSLIIGPGLGRDPTILDTVSKIIVKAKEQNLPMVIDADGLFLVTSDPAIIKDYENVILTPNVAEFSRLYLKVVGTKYEKKDPVQELNSLCSNLGHVTIVQKGEHDMISDGHRDLICSEEGSLRRCGGQGDLLSGSMGLFFFWSKLKASQEKDSSLFTHYGPSITAAYAACALTRACSNRAFRDHGRSMTASDLVPQIQFAFEDLFS